METIIRNLSDSIGTSILYSLLQGLFVYLLLRIIFLIFTNLKAVHKYNLALLAFAAVSLWFFATLTTNLYQQTWVYHTAKKISGHFDFDLALASLRELPVSYYYVYAFSFKPYLPYLSIFYTAGLLIQFTLIAYHQKQLSRLKQTLVPDTSLNEQIERLSAKLGFSKKIRAGISNGAIVPCVAGHFKPILFLPASIYTGLSAEQIESILLHELAHIKRNDYLINYIQQVFTALLFFNPFVILLNRIIATEREHCCDDLVIAVTEQPLTYAQALLDLQQAAQPIRLTLAAKSKGFLLLNRIQRIMKTEKPVSNFKPLILSIALLVGGMVSIAWFKPVYHNGTLALQVKRKVSAAPNIKIKKTEYPITSPKEPVQPKLPLVIHTDSNKIKFKDARLEKLLAVIQEINIKRQQLFDSTSYRNMVNELAEKVQTVTDFYSQPEIKERLQQIPKDISWYNYEIDALTAKVNAISLSPAYKAAEKEIERKYGYPKYIEMYTDRVKYEKYKKEIQQLKEEYFAKDVTILMAVSKEMTNYMDSPDFKNRQSSKSKSDSLKSTFDTPEIKSLKVRINILKKQVRDYTSNQSFKNYGKEFSVAADSLTNYLKSPEYKSRLEAFKKRHPESINSVQ